jgi:D-beta-D-heptose 7-phosphate kinase/D-beta-D-heptose 1-phosphate adenosyltransferase
VSAETPTLVVRHDESKISYGGAGLFVRNVLELGGKVSFITLMGDDEHARNYKNFRHKNLKIAGFKETNRRTTVKERFWSKNQKLLCWDRLDNRPISLKTEKSILVFVKKNLGSFDKLIVSDYRHGLIGENLVKALVKEAKRKRKPIYIDSQISQNIGNHKWYIGADLFCLNEKEAKSVDKKFNISKTKNSLIRLSKILKSPRIILKLGERGSASFIHGKYVETPAYLVKTADTVGAGDAFFAVISLLPNDFDEIGLKIANAWAALSTAVIGAEPPDFKRFKLEIEKING